MKILLRRCGSFSAYNFDFSSETHKGEKLTSETYNKIIEEYAEWVKQYVLNEFSVNNDVKSAFSENKIISKVSFSCDNEYDYYGNMNGTELEITIYGDKK